MADKICEEILAESRNGQKSIRELCKEKAANTGLSAEGLRSAFKRFRKEKDRPHLNMEFSENEEKVITALALAFAARGMPLSKRLLLTLVKKAFKKPEDWKGDGWFRGFKERNAKQLSFRSSKDLDADRVSKVSKELIDSFVATFEKLQEENSFRPDFIINVDETSCNLKNSHATKVLTSAKAAKQGSIKAPPSPLRTLIPFVAASGRVWMVVYIFKRVSPKSAKAKDAVLLHPVKTVTRSNWTSYYAMTEEGYITNDLWIEVIDAFVALIKVHLGDRPALLLLDRVGSHLEDTSLVKLLANSIEPLFLPAHTSHILQPLDDSPFATLKAKGHEEKNEEIIRRQLHGEPLDTVTQDAIAKAEKLAFTTDIIAAGFKNTGIWPFDAKLIRERFAKEYGWTEETKPKSKVKSCTETIMETVDAYFNTNKADVKLRARAINEKGKLFRGSEIHQMHVETQKIKAEKEAKKAETAKVKEEKKRKAEESKAEKGPRKKAKVVEESSEEEPSPEISPSQRMNCSGCNNYFRSVWTCNICKNFNLCRICQCEVKLIEDHRVACKN